MLGDVLQDSASSNKSLKWDKLFFPPPHHQHHRRRRRRHRHHHDQNYHVHDAQKKQYKNTVNVSPFTWHHLVPDAGLTLKGEGLWAGCYRKLDVLLLAT